MLSSLLYLPLKFGTFLCYQGHYNFPQDGLAYNRYATLYVEDPPQPSPIPVKRGRDQDHHSPLEEDSPKQACLSEDVLQGQLLSSSACPPLSPLELLALPRKLLLLCQWMICPFSRIFLRKRIWNFFLSLPSIPTKMLLCPFLMSLIG